MSKLIRYYLDNLQGKEAYLEVNWNKHAQETSALRIVIGKEKAVVDSGDLETILLAFTKKPEKFLKNESKKMGLKYVPVPIDQYKKYKRWQAEMKHRTGKDMKGDINKFNSVADE